MRTERTLTHALPLTHAVARTHARRAYPCPRLTFSPSRTPWLAPTRVELTLTRALLFPTRAHWGSRLEHNHLPPLHLRAELILTLA
ncbi:hypothetical protein B0H16DRAFT_1716190 [Mycena metata]|uniref:Uncharacterized protein n=1 Tax=Mycena metata TaxID=1033252 RepID=A0AAD7JP54_9AGAR|nr:hypothetical protein B0H16DRAFT_1716190 [Mycena metata]